MPAKKGRKRRRTREQRQSADAAPTVSAQTAAAVTPRKARPAASNGPLPSTTARVTGLMIAVLTAFFAFLMVHQSVTGDASGIDGVARIAGGIALIILAMVVGTLSVAPGMVREWFARRR